MAKRPCVAAGPPFLAGAYTVEERVSDWRAFPFNLPFVSETRHWKAFARVLVPGQPPE